MSQTQNYDGSSYFVYGGASAPTNAFDKDDAAYTQIGKLVNTDIPGARDIIDISAKQDYPARKIIGGERRDTLNFTCRFDHTEEDGQEVVMDAYYSATGLMYFCVSTGVTGDLVFSGSGIVTNRPVTLNMKSASEVSFTVEVDGDLTRTILT